MSWYGAQDVCQGKLYILLVWVGVRLCLLVVVTFAYAARFVICSAGWSVLVSGMDERVELFGVRTGGG